MRDEDKQIIRCLALKPRARGDKKKTLLIASVLILHVSYNNATSMLKSTDYISSDPRTSQHRIICKLMVPRFRMVCKSLLEHMPVSRDEIEWWSTMYITSTLPTLQTS